MNFLEHKIPPPIILLLMIALIVVLSRYDQLISLPDTVRLSVAVLFGAVGIFVTVCAIKSFAKAATTVNPLEPSKASQLVTSGVFKFTRNPMYLGLVLIASSVVVYFSVLTGIVLLIGFILYLTYFQIVPEERAMTELFGDQFTEYKKQVRRWL